MQPKPKHLEMYALRLQNLSYEEIGRKFGMTRQGAHNMINRYFPKYARPKVSRLVSSEAPCPNCKNHFLHLPRANQRRVFCSRKCQAEFKAINEANGQFRCSRCKKYSPRDGVVSHGQNWWYCLECNRDRTKAFYQKNPKRCYELVKKSAKKYPHKAKARAMVAWALKTGRLTKPERCEECLEVKVVQGHHPDYSKPLEVKWVCVRCHAKLDRELETQ